MALSFCVRHILFGWYTYTLRTHTSVHEGQGQSANSGKEKSTSGSGTAERGSKTCQVGFLFLINMGWLSLFLKCELFLKRCCTGRGQNPRRWGKKRLYLLLTLHCHHRMILHLDRQQWNIVSVFDKVLKCVCVCVWGGAKWQRQCL